jgi:CRP/FNR family cyclic AMP-dependent transcriptional regulator
MYLNGNTPVPGFEQAVPKLQHLAQEMLSGFEFTQDVITFESVEDLYELFDEDTLFLVNDGIINLTSNDVTLISYEEGDLIGIANSFHLPSPCLTTDGYVELQPVNRDDFLLHLYDDKRRQHCWTHYLVTMNAIMMNKISTSTDSQAKPAAGFLNFAPGQTIIQQGDDADMVYTLISGEANVLVDGTIVGQLEEEEVFGAMAAFTKEKRSASIVAQSHCSVMAVPQEDFTILIEAQPRAAVNLIQGLAKRILIMNKQLLESPQAQTQNM